MDAQFNGNEIEIAKNRDKILTEYAEYLFTSNKTHDQLSPETLAFESKFNEILPKNYPAAMMYFEAHKAAKCEDTSIGLLKEIKQMLVQQSLEDQKLIKLLQHDIDLFKEFDKKFSEARIDYTLERISTSTKLSDYDLSTWYDIKRWLEQVSNTFVNKNVQDKGQDLLKAFNGLTLFTSTNYFVDHNNWSTEDDSNVSEAEWRMIHEARIYKWEPDEWNSKLYNERESIIKEGIAKHVPAVEEAYKSFRLSVKKNLGV